MLVVVALAAVALIGCGGEAPDVSQTDAVDVSDSKVPDSRTNAVDVSDSKVSDSEASDSRPSVAKPVIDLKRREVKVKARICLTRGILEFATVIHGGREHEAIFSTGCLPSNLHTALLMIGMEPYSFVADNPGWYKKALKSKSRIKFEVEFDDRDQKRRVPVHKLLKNRETDSGDTEDAWVFTGSFFSKYQGKSVYAADHSDVVISIMAARAEVIQFAAKTGNPYQGEELGIEVVIGDTGKFGQEVMLVFSPWYLDESKTRGRRPVSRSSP